MATLRSQSCKTVRHPTDHSGAGRTQIFTPCGAAHFAHGPVESAKGRPNSSCSPGGHFCHVIPVRSTEGRGMCCATPPNKTPTEAGPVGRPWRQPAIARVVVWLTPAPPPPHSFPKPRPRETRQGLAFCPKAVFAPELER